jgi:hypothetical protein
MFPHPRFSDCFGSSPSPAACSSQELPPESGTSAREGQDADRSILDLHAPAYCFDDEPPDPAEDITRQRSARDLPLSFCWSAATNWTAILDLPPRAATCLHSVVMSHGR